MAEEPPPPPPPSMPPPPSGPPIDTDTGLPAWGADARPRNTRRERWSGRAHRVWGWQKIGVVVFAAVALAVYSHIFSKISFPGGGHSKAKTAQSDADRYNSGNEKTQAQRTPTPAVTVSATPTPPAYATTPAPTASPVVVLGNQKQTVFGKANALTESDPESSWTQVRFGVVASSNGNLLVHVKFENVDMSGNTVPHVMTPTTHEFDAPVMPWAVQVKDSQGSVVQTAPIPLEHKSGEVVSSHTFPSGTYGPIKLNVDPTAGPYSVHVLAGNAKDITQAPTVAVDVAAQPEISFGR